MDSLKAQEASAPICAASQISFWGSVKGNSERSPGSAAAASGAASVRWPEPRAAAALLHLREALIEGAENEVEVGIAVRRRQEAGEALPDVNALLAEMVEEQPRELLVGREARGTGSS